MANDQKPVISVRKLRKVYMMGQEHVVALHNIDLDIPRGEVCCIFGTSGSGKSTLLNQLAGLEKPTRGVVRIGGVPISQLNENQLAAFRQKHIGFVFQSYNLLPELTAVEPDGGVAKLYRLPGAKGNIGLISPVNAHFCGSCNRIRLTADGKLKPCLHSSVEYDIKGLDFDGMRSVMEKVIYNKPAWHGLLDADNPSHAGRNMNQIGG